MSSRHHFDHQSKIIHTYWEGEINDDDAVQAITDYVNQIHSQIDIVNSYNEVLSFLGVTSIQVTPSGIKNIAKIADNSGLSDNKLAIVVRSGIGFSFAKLYQIYRMRILKGDKDIGIFKSHEDAILWIDEAIENDPMLTL